MDFISLFRGIIGIVVLISIAFLLSNNKKRISWKLVGAGLLLQVIFAVFVLKGDVLGRVWSPLEWPRKLIEGIGYWFVQLLGFASEGAKFVFGPLAIPPGSDGSMGTIFAFQVLPIIILFASLMSLGYYFGIMQRIVKAVAWVMAKTMGTSGAESLTTAAEIFVGPTESPLVIRPYLKGLTKSELLTIMVAGMATIAGSVVGAYIQILSQAYSKVNNIPVTEAQTTFATHILAASVMAAPAALLIAKIIFPETEEPETKGVVKVPVEKNASNVIEAAVAGASDGLSLVLNVGAMIIAFIALVALLNAILGYFGNLTGINSYLLNTYHQPLSMQLVLGIILQYVAVAIGVPWNNALQFGSLIGTKVVLNEFVAYVDMSKMLQLKQLTDQKVIFMTTYALCGFANIGSIAIQIGGISPLIPHRRSEIASLGIRALIGASLANLMTATFVGIFY
jgi:CNT family concentrative nucleoside transporter